MASGMIRSYLKTTARSLMRQRLFAAINTAGLALGMACSLLILLYVRHEVSYESFNEDADRVFRVVRGQEELYQPAPIGPLIAETFPEVDAVARTFVIVRPLIARGDIKIHHDVTLADPAFFDILDIPFVRGDRSRALEGDFRVAVSTRVARAYFGDEDPIGQLLRYDNGNDYEVTGVFELPTNTHFPIEIVCSYSSIWVDDRWGPIDPADWWGSGTGAYIYLRLHRGQEIRDFEERLLAAVGRHYEWVPDQWRREELLPRLQRLTDIHLHSHSPQEYTANGEAEYVTFLGGIGAFVLFIACVNFVSLSTARSTERVREVGIRKALGAYQTQLRAQFLCESGLQVLAASVVALALSWLALGPFSALAEREMAVAATLGDVAWIAAGLLVIAVLGAGYPAVVLARLLPTRIFREGAKAGALGGGLRRRLVEFQFALAILLVLATAVVLHQFRFMQDRDVGFVKDDTIWLRMGHRGIYKRSGLLVDRLRTLPSAVGVARYQARPFEGLAKGSTNRVRFADAEEPIIMPVIEVDEYFVPVMELDLVAGRNVAAGLGPDAVEVLVNETAVTTFGASGPREVLGQPIDLGWRGAGTVVGVVRDFHWESLHRTIGPAVMKAPRWVPFPNEEGIHLYYSNVVVRFRPERLHEGLQQVEEVWADFTQDYPLEYRFLDEVFQRQYDNEARLAKLLAGFAALAVFVAALGVLALVAFTVRQRTKEIGVRKALGSTTRGVLLLLARDFGRLFLVGALAAWPVAWWLMAGWLDGFAYRVEPSLAVFAAATSVVLLAAVLAAGQQAIRAARTNPVEALRYE